MSCLSRKLKKRGSVLTLKPSGAGAESEARGVGYASSAQPISKRRSSPRKVQHAVVDACRTKVIRTFVLHLAPTVVPPA